MSTRERERVAQHAAIDRRLFLLGAAGFGGALLTSAIGAQQQQPNFTPMEQDAYRPVLRPAKPGASPQLHQCFGLQRGGISLQDRHAPGVFAEAVEVQPEGS